jgi:hypothetical protein
VGRYHLNVKRALLRTALSLVALAAVVYLGDDLSLRLQIPKRPQFGTVHIQPYLAVPRKDGRIEYMLDDPVDQPCVHSLLPHLGASPCWYLERQKNKRINM